MAVVLNSHQRAVFEAQERIFNTLCAAFRRSGENSEFRLSINDVRTELDLPASIFAEALEKFAYSIGEHTVIVVEQNGQRYITLGESAKSNVSDWIYIPRPVVSAARSLTGQSTRLSNNGLRYTEAVFKNR
jgi:hypothetical protein